MGIHDLKMGSYFFRKVGKHGLDYSCVMSVFTRDFAYVLTPGMDANPLHSHRFWNSLVCDRGFIWCLQSNQ